MFYAAQKDLNKLLPCLDLTFLGGTKLFDAKEANQDIHSEKKQDATFNLMYHRPEKVLFSCDFYSWFLFDHRLQLLSSFLLYFGDDYLTTE